MLYQIQPLSEAQTSLAESLEAIKVKGIKGFKFKKQKWGNLECDVYFNRFFLWEKEKA